MVTSQQRVWCEPYHMCTRHSRTVVTLTSLGDRQKPLGVGNPQSVVIPLSEGLFGFTHFAVLNDDLEIFSTSSQKQAAADDPQHHTSGLKLRRWPAWYRISACCKKCVICLLYRGNKGVAGHAQQTCCKACRSQNLHANK